ncbi:MAG: hypothetical protein ACRKFN_11555 [Desulfitobacterium sp.]
MNKSIVMGQLQKATILNATNILKTHYPRAKRAIKAALHVQGKGMGPSGASGRVRV